MYTEGLSIGTFQNDPLIQDGVSRQLEIIGEATKRISEEVKLFCGDVPWKDMAGMRDVIIHNDMYVEIEMVWDTAINIIPHLESRITEVLLEINKS